MLLCKTELFLFKWNVYGSLMYAMSSLVDIFICVLYEN